MNTFWLKVAAAAVLIVVGLMLFGKLRTGADKPAAQTKEPGKTFYDVARKDDERLRAEPKQAQEKAVEEPAEEQQQFSQLNEEEQVEAERLFEMALMHRKQARLPGMGGAWGQVVNYSRQIIEKWPDSVYAYKARRMLGEVPERLRRVYNITDEELKP